MKATLLYLFLIIGALIYADVARKLPVIISFIK